MEMMNRTNFAYLSYDDMLARIETGEINEYDVVYSKDRLVTYFISENLKPIEIHSRVYVFNSIDEAETFLNSATDTYIGQIVAILYKEKYRGYMVNKKDDRYIVVSLYDNPEVIDYDNLGNRPIINLLGTLDKPILVSTLSPGIYKIKGQYKISNLEETIYLSADGDLILVDNNKIKKITSDTIEDFSIGEDSFIKKTYITNEYLKENKYATESYLDTKIEALNSLIKADIQKYVQEAISQEIDSIVETKIDEKINPLTNDEVNNIFHG